MAVIEARGLRKQYGQTLAVDGVDLAIDRGQVVAVLGPNGAGKTTLIEILLDLRVPDAGSVTLFGRPPGSAAVKARVGAMLQDTDAPESHTVREIVALVRHYYPWALPVSDVLARADLVEKAGARVGQLSGGQRQRLSFAMAIVGDPDLLFLDEPTSALDVEARRAFWGQVRGFAELGKTVLFATHNMDEAETLADRVMVISAGRVIADGTPADIKAMVAARTVTVTTDAELAWLSSAPGVVSARVDQAASSQNGVRRVVIQATEAEPLLHEMFTAGLAVRDLSVVDTDMEAAFVHLTSGGQAPERGGQPA